MAYGLPYGMASQNVALCVFIAAFLHVSLGKTWIYRFQGGKYLRDVDSLKNRKKKEDRSEVMGEEKRKSYEFLIRTENHRIPPFLPAPNRHDSIVPVTFAPPFFAPVSERIKWNLFRRHRRYR